MSFVGTITVCPKCGKDCEVIPGSYDADKTRLNLLIDESVSSAALTAIKSLAEKVQANEITPQQARVEAEKIDKNAGKLFDVADWSDQAKATLYVGIITTVGLIVAAKLNSSPESVTNVYPKETTTIEKVIEHGKDSSALTKYPIPTQRPKERR